MGENEEKEEGVGKCYGKDWGRSLVIQGKRSGTFCFRNRFSGGVTERFSRATKPKATLRTKTITPQKADDENNIVTENSKNRKKKR